jgi:hypothetical protein
MNKNRFFIMIALLWGVGISSCKKLINVPLPPNEITAASVFNDSSTAVPAALSMYVNLLSGEKTEVGDLDVYIDELTPLNAGSEPAIFYPTIIPVSDGGCLNLWRYLYGVIYQANDIITRVPASAALSVTLQDRLVGEALFCRAYSYFYLTNYFGDVPLVLTTDLSGTASVARSSSDTVYSQVIADLQRAENLLLGSYAGEERVRATKWAAASLLSRAYLYKGDFAQADSAASAVINSNSFSLSPLSSAFAKTSSELILSLYSSTGYSLGSGYIPSTNTSKPSYFVDTVLLNAFEPADLRLTNWIGTTTYSGTMYAYPFKYKARNATSQPNGPEYYILLRLAEQYLIRAEAKENESDIAGAIADVNTLHTRAGLSAYSSNISAGVCDSLIQHERRVELFTENVLRFFDLRRKGDINAVMQALKPSTWQTRAALLPIPANELLLNPQLTQNQGY